MIFYAVDIQNSAVDKYFTTSLKCYQHLHSHVLHTHAQTHKHLEALPMADMKLSLVSEQYERFDFHTFTWACEVVVVLIIE